MTTRNQPTLPTRLTLDSHVNLTTRDGSGRRVNHLRLTQAEVDVVLAPGALCHNVIDHRTTLGLVIAAHEGRYLVLWSEDAR